MRAGWIVPLVGLVFAVSACSGGGMYSDGPVYGTPVPGTPGPTATQTATPAPTPAPGQLTAGDWDDNLNFDFFQHYESAVLTTSGLGLPAQPSADRVVITVRDAAGQPLPAAQVTIRDASGVVLDAPTATDGRLLFFPGFDGASGSLTVDVAPPPSEPGTPLHVAAPPGKTWSFTLAGSAAALPDALDLAFVIDCTGSMADELEYLKSEIGAIATDVHDANPGVAIRYGLVVYRDVGDDYVTKSYDFGSLASFETAIAAQSASGGGDYEESVQAGMQAAEQLSWTGGRSLGVMFLVGDAPPHVQDAPAFLDAANALRRRGIKIYPVGASGVGLGAEYLFRIAAEETLSRYLFLTDDSGIGNAHEPPHIPCYQVQYLQVLMRRTIVNELAGTHVPPSPSEVLRTVGDPVNGVCHDADTGEDFYTY